MDIYEWIFEFAVGKAITAIVSKLTDKGISTIAGMPLPFRYSAHFIELENKIKRLPFIYRDLGGDVLNDFVEIEFNPLENSTLEVRPLQRFEASIDHRLTHRRKVVLIGSGGIGKTTFVRHTALQLVKDRGHSKKFVEGEYLIPFYVPLKGIDNSEPYPILRYILETNRMLSGKNGVDILTRLARKKQLFLLLDGYDEIPVPSSSDTDNYVLKELELLLGGNEPSQREGHRAFFEAATECRAWITSRPEFFQQYSFARDPNSLALELKGIGKHRATLAKRIFDKYRDRSRRLNELLSEEYFIQDIDTRASAGLEELSYNPLFLTVMAYTYAQKVISSGEFNTSWARDVNELILECVKLLLIDLDDAKARDLPSAFRSAQRQAIMRRRNSYTEEKLKFLEYFALALLMDYKPLFDRDYITAKAKEYFLPLAKEPVISELLRNLDKTSKVTNFVGQLIFSGLFVVVQRIGQDSFIDFPHRRFREALAVRHMEATNTAAINIALLVRKPWMQESVTVLFETRGFQHIILESLCAMIEEQLNEPAGATLLACLSKAPHEFDPTPIICSMFERCSASNTAATMPSQVLNFLRDTSKYGARWSKLWSDAVTESLGNSLNLQSKLLVHFFGYSFLDDRLCAALIETIDDRKMRTTLMRVGIEGCHEALASALPQILASESAWLDLAAIAARYGRPNEDLWRFCKIAFDQASDDQFLAFIYVCRAINLGFDSELVRRMTLSPGQEVLAAIARAGDTRPLNRRTIHNCHIVTSPIIAAAQDYAGQLKLDEHAIEGILAPVRGQVYFNDSLLTESDDEPPADTRTKTRKRSRDVKSFSQKMNTQVREFVYQRAAVDLNLVDKLRLVLKKTKVPVIEINECFK